MNEKKIDAVIGEVIHIACQAELAADEQVKRQALGDIYDALASVLPVDHSRTGRAPTPGVATDRRDSAGREGTPGTVKDGKVVVYKTPQHILDFIAEIANVPFADMADPALLKGVAETHHLVPNKGEADYFKVAEGVRLQRYKATNVTRLIAVRKGLESNPDVIFEIFINNTTKKATVKRDDTVLFTIGVDGLNPSHLMRASVAVLRSYLKHQVKIHRNGKERIHRRAAERAATGVATPGREGAARTGEEG